MKKNRVLMWRIVTATIVLCSTHIKAVDTSTPTLDDSSRLEQAGQTGMESALQQQPADAAAIAKQKAQQEKALLQQAGQTGMQSALEQQAVTAPTFDASAAGRLQQAGQTEAKSALDQQQAAAQVREAKEKQEVAKATTSPLMAGVTGQVQQTTLKDPEEEAAKQAEMVRQRQQVSQPWLPQNNPGYRGQQQAPQVSTPPTQQPPVQPEVPPAQVPSQQAGPAQVPPEQPPAPAQPQVLPVQQPAPPTTVPPAPPTQAPTPQPEPEEEPSLLDTIDIEEGGNWVLKRKALQDTVRKIEDINELYDKIRDTNVVFLQGMNAVDKLFTHFVYDMGYDLGKLDHLVLDITNHMNQEREEDGDLDEQERRIIAKATEHKKEIDQLQVDIKAVWRAYNQLKEARKLNDDQIIQSDRLRKQAWRNFRMIERVLNEVKAEELYQDTVQLYQTMQNTYQYLQAKLIPHFQQSMATVQTKIKEISQETDELQKFGIALGQKTAEIEKEEERQKSLAQQPKEEIEQDEIKKPEGWFATIKRILWVPFAAVGNFWSWLTGGSNDVSQYLPDENEEDSNAPDVVEAASDQDTNQITE